jgi:hypothetical protein
MYGDSYMSSRARGKRWGYVVLLGIAFLIVAGAGINMLLAGAGVIHDSSEPRGTKSILESFIWLVGAAICVVLAIHFEHRARGLPSGPIAARVDAMGEGVRSRVPAGLGVPRRRRYGPVSTLIGGIVFALLGVAMVFFSFSAHAQAAKSSYTQSSGVSESATVVNVDNNQNTNCGSHGACTTTYSAQVAVSLQTPVSGQDTATVNVPANVSYTTGQQISVLVDPKDPGYAELPGQPYATQGSTVALIIGAVVVFVLGMLAVVRAVRMRLHGQAWQAMRPVTG